MVATKAQVTIPTTTAAAGDVSMNTWCFRVPDLTDSTFFSVTAALQSFYNHFKAIYPAAMNFAAANVKFYSMADPKPRPPIFEALLGTTGTGAGTSGPGEVALCMSFYGTRVAGTNPARTRGRIYLGPFAASFVNNPQPSSSLITPIITAANELLANSQVNPWEWCVWSQAQSDDPQGTLFPDISVIGGWVDNAWDTQRRRGVAPSQRTTFGALPTRAFPQILPT